MQVRAVKPRFDGKGDAWALSHRDGLGPTFNMHDVDAMVGFVSFAENTGDRLFIEYVPDNYRNRESRVRQFGVIAYFDRKQSLDYAMSSKNALSLAVYLHQCRAVSSQQPVSPKFFLVIGGQQPPWEMHGVDIFTGAPTGEKAVVDGLNWASVWRALGLTSLRDELRRWVDPRSA